MGNSAKNSIGGLGRRDADRELWRAKQAKRRRIREQHENPPVWAYHVPQRRQETGR